MLCGFYLLASPTMTQDDPALSPGEEFLAQDAEEVRVGHFPADSAHEPVARVSIMSSRREREKK